MKHNSLHTKLNQRKSKGIFRSLSFYDGMTDFISNDYLGLAKIKQKIEVGGSTGSRLISGNSIEMEKIEQDFADFFESESGLFFNSGFDANLGIFASIPQKGEVVLYDKLVHASTREGLKISNAQNFGFKHNDLEDLERLLQKNQDKTTYIAIEGLYSMDGDIPPLKQMVDLAKKYNAEIILDEAHSAGIFGNHGKGLAVALNLQEDIFIRLITFGKAFGRHGSLVLGPKIVREYLINFASSLIYTTAFDSTHFQSILELINRADFNDRRIQLQENMQFFRENLSDEFRLRSKINSPIQIIEFGSIEKLKATEKALLKAEIAVKAIYSPTVPAGQECLRICLHSYNSKEEIQSLTKSLNELK